MNEDLYLESLKRISERLDAIDLKLNNHMTHIAGDISAMRTDIGWLKNGKKPDDEKGQNANIGWLTWAVRLMIGGIVMNFIGMIFMIYKLIK
jgi:hypothetical protein